MHVQIEYLESQNVKIVTPERHKLTSALIETITMSLLLKHVPLIYPLQDNVPFLYLLQT